MTTELVDHWLQDSHVLACAHMDQPAVAVDGLDVEAEAQEQGVAQDGIHVAGPLNHFVVSHHRDVLAASLELHRPVELELGFGGVGLQCATKTPLRHVVLDSNHIAQGAGDGFERDFKADRLEQHVHVHGQGRFPGRLLKVIYPVQGHFGRLWMLTALTGTLAGNSYGLLFAEVVTVEVSDRHFVRTLVSRHPINA